MAFDALQKLDKEKLDIVVNELIRGVSAKAIARTIQEEWCVARGFSAGTLEQQLKTLRTAICDGALRCDPRSEVPSITSAAGFEINPIDKLTWLANLHEKRILRFYTAELRQNKMDAQLGKSLSEYGRLLIGLQKMRFELGLDEYKRVTLSRREREAAAAKAKEEEREKTYRQIQKVAETMDEVFAANREKLRARGLQERMAQSMPNKDQSGKDIELDSISAVSRKG